ncbi:hypothetical protein C2857_007126 [Epichloe festucae Fl1]|uniref:Heme haloperoxidase family profile domain-containing protein n=1 Tax=Epichloe festucae (strain Fl1) TaxID=877507 RepID=A0A7S9KQH1_EPIFF|nr:hypothetical protein C2857_007126 [Epichloe festucae Fl1]
MVTLRAVLASALVVTARADDAATAQTEADAAMDQRLFNYQAPGPNDSRSPCPGLNTLANHGFIPHNGRNVNFVNLVAAALEGLGTSPETSALVAGIGLASSHNPLTLGFDLEDLRNHLFLIEHDCSISRNDEAVGNNNKFNPELWDVALKVLNQSDTVSPINLGNAKAARIANQRKLNPKTDYGPRAAAFGGIEMGMILSALSTPSLNPLSGRSMTADGLKDSFGTPDGLYKALTFGLGNVKTEYLRSIFEDERLPTHLGWRPTPETNNVFTAVAIGVIALASDPDLLKDVAGVALGTPMDVLGAVLPIPKQVSTILSSMSSQLESLGHKSKFLRAAHKYLEENDHKMDEQMFWNVAAAGLSPDEQESTKGK